MLTSSLLGCVVCCVEDPTPRVNRSRSVPWPNVIEEEEIQQKNRAVPDSESPQMLHISRPTTRTNMKLSSFLHFNFFLGFACFFKLFFLFSSQFFPHTRRRRRRQPNVIISYFYFAHKRGCDCRNTSHNCAAEFTSLFFCFVCVKPPTTF